MSASARSRWTGAAPATRKAGGRWCRTCGQAATPATTASAPAPRTTRRNPRGPGRGGAPRPPPRAGAGRRAGANTAAGRGADVLYTARWFWTGHMGDSKDARWRRFKLWNAYYDGDPDIDFASAPYGPGAASELVGEQYQGTTQLGGASVDL